MEKNKRKELLEEYKQMKTYMGVFQITNKLNGKIYVGSYPNLKNKWLTLQMQLNMGRFANSQFKEIGKNEGANHLLMRCWKRKTLEK
jgi:hypothetical protein